VAAKALPHPFQAAFEGLRRTVKPRWRRVAMTRGLAVICSFVYGSRLKALMRHGN